MPEEYLIKKVAGKRHIVAVYEIRGERIEVWFDPENNFRPFTAEYKGKTAAAKEIDALLDDLKRITKRPRITVHIEVSRRDGRDGIVTGLHGANGNVLITWVDNGQSEQITTGYRYSSHSDGSWFTRLTDEQKAELKQLRKIAQEAESALKDFERDYGINPSWAANEAIEEKLEASIKKEEANVDTDDTAQGDS